MKCIAHGVIAVAAIASIALSRQALAQSTLDIEVPAVIIEGRSGDDDDDLSDIDLANIVQSAAKGVTTVQEAPAIVTVITESDIRERGIKTIDMVADFVPGWLRASAYYDQFPYLNARGLLQGVIYLHNGLSLYDAFGNAASTSRVQPMETIKRIELITGPGGVLWGANSYLGLMNVITKRADDVDGIEAGASFGDGPGDRGFARGYVMAGDPDLLSTGAKLFLHTSFETYIGPEHQLPQISVFSPPPQINSPNAYGPLTTASPPRSLLFDLSGNVELGPLTVFFQAPFTERHLPLGFPGFVVREDLPEDTLRDPDGSLACPDEPPFNDPADRCLDRGRQNRDNQANWFERYVSAVYQDRFAGGRAGATVRAYAVQFNRDFERLGGFAATQSGVVEGGLAFQFDGTAYRSGLSYDGDIDFPGDWRLLYGAEAFREWVPNTIDRSRQGAGAESTFFTPYDLSRLPLQCPLRPSADGAIEYVPGCPLTFLFQSDRAVIGGYANPQWRATERLVLDAGARVQAAPDALGSLSYDPVALFSGAMVYRLADGWYTKLNYAEGFRAPVFNQTKSNPEAVQLGGDPDLDIETSRSGQGEINARLWQGERSIRELFFRADYSYTRLDNVILPSRGRYINGGERGIHSAEFLARLFLDGGHRVELSYTWLATATSDRGAFRAFPEHWFNMGGFFALSERVLLHSNLRVVGAHEDPNRLVEFRDYRYDDAGFPVNVNTGVVGPLFVAPHEMVLDRLAPVADLTAGVSVSDLGGFRLSAFVYNAFNQLYNHPDLYFDYEPRLEFQPSPAERLRFSVNASYAY